MPLDIHKIRQWVAKQKSTADAARLLKMHRPSLIQILEGNRANVTIDTLERIAFAMGVAPGELIRRAQKITPPSVKIRG
jgi:transcriptional regulator with XRE-family HTH domain